jgi:hypothetical protein
VSLVSEWEGRRHVVVLSARERRHIAVAKLLAGGSQIGTLEDRQQVLSWLAFEVPKGIPHMRQVSCCSL